jgi:NAD-dependent deacetylase
MFIPRVYANPDRKIIIFSGAGLDQPSGIQTFRDSNGLWNNHDVDLVCNERTWKKNFNLVHSFYNDLRNKLSTKEPNIAHTKIVDISNKYGKDNVFNITMNISDFFERLELETLHLHGELTKMECQACGNNWEIGYSEFDVKKDRCPKCNSLNGVRPKIVFFGGQAPMYTYFSRAIEYLKNTNSIIIVIGTESSVINISNIIEKFKCKKILCNIDAVKDMKEEQFDIVYHESIETAIIKIEKDIENIWE